MTLLQALLADGVRGAEIFDTGQDLPVPPQMPEVVSDVRRRDFSLGRACASAALDRLGERGVVARAAHGAPLWPDGVTGSITHTSGYAAAIVAHTKAFRGLGIDAEQLGRVEEKLWPRLFTDGERAWLARQDDADTMATLLFAAKEAAFKAGNPGAGASLHFHGFEIAVTGPASFRLHGQPHEGRYAIGAGLALALVLLR